MAIDFRHSKQLTLVQPVEGSPQLTPGHRQPLHPRLACIIEETLNVHHNSGYMRKICGDQCEVCLTHTILIISDMVHSPLLTAAMC
jgi:hypothetical protein